MSINFYSKIYNFVLFVTTYANVFFGVVDVCECVCIFHVVTIFPALPDFLSVCCVRLPFHGTQRKFKVIKSFCVCWDLVGMPMLSMNVYTVYRYSRGLHAISLLCQPVSQLSHSSPYCLSGFFAMRKQIELDRERLLWNVLICCWHFAALSKTRPTAKRPLCTSNFGLSSYGFCIRTIKRPTTTTHRIHLKIGRFGSQTHHILEFDSLAQ